MQNGLKWCINTQVCAMKSHRNFSQLTHPIPLIGILTHVLVHFVLFCYCRKLGEKQAELEQLMQKFVA